MLKLKRVSWESTCAYWSTFAGTHMQWCRDTHTHTVIYKGTRLSKCFIWTQSAVATLTSWSVSLILTDQSVLLTPKQRLHGFYAQMRFLHATTQRYYRELKHTNHTHTQSPVLGSDGWLVFFFSIHSRRVTVPSFTISEMHSCKEKKWKCVSERNTKDITTSYRLWMNNTTRMQYLHTCFLDASHTVYCAFNCNVFVTRFIYFHFFFDT